MMELFEYIIRAHNEFKPLNKDADRINRDVITKLSRVYKIYYSHDTVKDQPERALELTTEFLNAVNISNLPPTRIENEKKNS